MCKLWRKELCDLLGNKKYNQVLCCCLNIINSRINNIFLYNKKKKQEKVQSSSEINYELIFNNLIKIFRKDLLKKKLKSILSKWRNTEENQFNEFFSIKLDNLISYFDDIYYVYGLIAICSIEIKKNSALSFFLELSHEILPCFIIGDLILLNKGKVEEWNTEKILISSILKVSDKAFFLEGAELLDVSTMNIMRNSYISWQICLDNWLEYSRIKLQFLGLFEKNLTEELISLMKHLKELFNFVSKSSLSMFHQACLVHDFCEVLFKSSSNFKFQEFDSEEFKFLFIVDINYKVRNNFDIFETLIKEINLLLEKKIYDAIFNLLICFNSLITLFINIVHKSIKYIKRNEILENNNELELLSKFTEDHPMYFEGYFFQIKSKSLINKLNEFHCLKLNLCLINSILFEKWTKLDETTEKYIDQVNIEKLFKLFTSSIFLTMGVISSLSDVKMDQKLLLNIKHLLDYQNSLFFFISRLLTKKFETATLFKNIESYCYTLVDCIIKKIFLINDHFDTELSIDIKLIDGIVESVITVLSTSSKLLEDYRELKSETNKFSIPFLDYMKLDIQVKTCICEIITRYIQYSNSIVDRYFKIMEKIIDGLLISEFTLDLKLTSGTDELILNFFLVVGENLTSLCSKLKQKKNYSDSIRVATLGLKCLSNLITMPWIYSSQQSILEIQKKFENLKLFEESDCYFQKENNRKSICNNLFSTPKKNFQIKSSNINSKILDNYLSGKFSIDSPINTNFKLFELNREFHLKKSNKNIGFEIDDNSNTPFCKKNEKFNDIWTPFTLRLRNKNLLQMQSQTIKKIQKSAMSNYISKSRNRKYKVNADEFLLNKMNDIIDINTENNLNYPIHILLFILILEQLLSSLNLQFGLKQIDTYLNLIIFSTEENLSKLFTHIDDYSFVFILYDESFVDLQWINNLDMFSKVLKDEKYMQIIQCKDIKIIRRQFFELIKSIISKYLRAKLLLISEFSADLKLLERFPEVSKQRNCFFRLFWFYSEIKFYKYYREENSKYTELFRKGMENGFSEELVRIYNSILDFNSEKKNQKKNINISNFHFYFEVQMLLFDYYFWLSNINKKYFFQSNSPKELKFIELCFDKMQQILKDLEFKINKINLNQLNVYLLRIKVLKTYLLSENTSKYKDSFNNWCKESFFNSKKIKKCFEECLYATIKLLDIRNHLKINIQDIFINNCYKHVSQFEKEIEVEEGIGGNMKIDNIDISEIKVAQEINNIDEDIPMPMKKAVNNHVNFQTVEKDKNYVACISEKNSFCRTNLESDKIFNDELLLNTDYNRNNVRFKTEDSNFETANLRRLIKYNNMMKIKDFYIFVDSIVKLFDILELQIESNFEVTLLNIILEFFFPCLSFLSEININKVSSQKKEISKYIEQYLFKFASEYLDFKHKFEDLDNEEMQIFQLNIGLLLSIFLYKAFRIFNLKTINSEYLKWLDIAHLYNEGLIFLIENQFLSGTFIEKSRSKSNIVNRILFQLVIIRIEHLYIDKVDEIFNLLKFLENLDIDDFLKNNYVNIALFSRLYNKISDLFLNLNKPDLSLLFLLESSKITQVLIYCYENNFIMDQFVLENHFFFSSISKISIFNLAVASLLKLAESWSKFGAIERSYSVYSRLISFCKDWTFSYNTILKIYFLKFPILINLSFSKNDNCVNFNQESDFSDKVENSNISSIKMIKFSLEELQDIIKSLFIIFTQVDKTQEISLFIQNILMMILITFTLYCSANKTDFKFLKNELFGIIPNSFYQEYEETDTSKEELKINLVLKKTTQNIAKIKENEVRQILMVIFNNLELKFENYYFNFFYNNIESYCLLLLSSIYVDIVGVFVLKKEKKKNSNQKMFILLDIYEKDLKNEFKQNKHTHGINFLIKEICIEIIKIKKLLNINLTQLEFNIIKDEVENSIEPELYVKNSFWLSILKSILNSNEKIRTKIQILNNLKLFVILILKNLILSKKLSNYILIYLNISIVLDVSLLILSLIYPNKRWNKILCDLINFLTPVTSAGNCSLFVYFTRKIQKKFEYYKMEASKNLTSNAYNNAIKSDYQDVINNCNILLKFLLSINYDEISTWSWEECFEKNKFKNNKLISNVYMRFSSFFTNSSLKARENNNFSLFQITRDFSFFKLISKSECKHLKQLSDSSLNTKLTLMYFLENNLINQFLENYKTLHYNNISSILNIDFKRISNKKTENWWNRRLEVEFQFENWLNKFSKFIFKDWVINLLIGWPKKFIKEKNNKELLKILSNEFLEFKSTTILNLVSFSLINDIPELVDLINKSEKLNIDFHYIHEKFKNLKFEPIEGTIEHFPIKIFLDKILMNLPIEGISELSFQPIIRGINEKMDSENLGYFKSKQKYLGKYDEYFSAKKCKIYYCINPTGDLENTEKFIVPYISELFKQNCKGISNSIPQSISLMQDMSFNLINLYLFCGHQAGEKFIQGELFEKGIVNKDGGDDIFNIPPSLLIGCSSSRIRSYGFYDLFFTPMHYLIGGSPFVLGALWDVTDQDIDRFTVSIFDIWFNSKMSLLESITLARKKCKLPLLNGSSCVCFGHPL